MTNGNRFSRKKICPKRLVTMVMQLVDLTQTTLSGLKAILRAAEAKRKLQYLSKLLWVLLNTWVVTKYVKPLLKTL